MASTLYKHGIRQQHSSKLMLAKHSSKSLIFTKLSKSSVSYDSKTDLKLLKRKSRKQVTKTINLISPGSAIFKADTSSDTKLNILKTTFEMASKGGSQGLNLEQFTEAIRRTSNREMTDEEIKHNFMKMDVDCDGTVDWTEYVTFQMFTRQVNDQLMQVIPEKPFVNEMKHVQARTHDAIVSIIFFPHIPKHSNRYDLCDGKYASLTRDGIVSFWTLEMKHKINFGAIMDDDRINKPWFLDMTCMYNVNMLALTTTDREFIFFDITPEAFLKRFVITGLENCVTSMDFWIDLVQRRFAIFMWGDTRGNIFALYFQVLRGGGLFASTSDKKDTAKRATFSEIMRGLVPHIKAYKMPRTHEDWVCKIKYVPQLNGFMSCCEKTNTALYLADFIKDRTAIYFKVHKGITCFDYSTQMNVIVSGGPDYVVRLWNPYLTHRAIALLKGHTRPVTYVFVNDSRHQVVSIDKEKTVNVFDLIDQSWVQHMSHRNIRLGPFPLTGVFFNEKLQHLILATNHLGLLEEKYEEKPTDVVSHKNPVVITLYNKTFKYLVTACEGSVVSVWNVTDGTKVMQFINAHSSVKDGIESPVEITAMAFDSQEKRVLTGARDGSVKMWNFNNGACLQELHIAEKTHVVAIVCSRDEIFVTGWSRNISVFLDGAGDVSRKTWPTRHNEDILCMIYNNPKFIATSSYDGDIILWLRDTGQAVCRFNAHESDEPIDLLNTYNTVSTQAKKASSVRDDSSAFLDVYPAASVARSSPISYSVLDIGGRRHFSLQRANTQESLHTELLAVAGSELDNKHVSWTARQSLFSRRDSGASKQASMLSRQNSVSSERQNLALERRHLSKDSSRKFGRSIFAKLSDSGEREEHLVVAKKKPKEFCEHPLLWALDRSAIVDQESEYNPKKQYPREEYDDLCKLYEAAVDTILFLESRDAMDKKTATLIAAGSEGWVRAWSIQGGLLGQFNAGHRTGSSITHMVTDESNKYLITSDSLGYVKVWDLVNYCTRNKMSADELQRHKEKMKKKFAFLRMPVHFFKHFENKMKAETVRPPPKTSKPEKNLKRPFLLNSFKAHNTAVNHMNMVNENYIITCSSDQSVRMWTIYGIYIGTFGEKWRISLDQIDSSMLTRPVPMDLRRTGSARTLWVLNGGTLPHWQTAFKVIRQIGFFRLLRKVCSGKKAKEEEEEDEEEKEEEEEEEAEAEAEEEEVEEEKKAEEETFEDTRRQSEMPRASFSKILGRSYKRQMRHKLPPHIPRLFESPCAFGVYHTLPFVDLTPVNVNQIPDVIEEINVRRLESHCRKDKGRECHAIANAEKVFVKFSIQNRTRFKQGEKDDRILAKYPTAYSENVPKLPPI